MADNTLTYQYILMPIVAEWSRRTYPAPLGAVGVGSIPANSDAQIRRKTCLLSAVGDLK